MAASCSTLTVKNIRSPGTLGSSINVHHHCLNKDITQCQMPARPSPAVGFTTSLLCLKIQDSCTQEVGSQGNVSVSRNAMGRGRKTQRPALCTKCSGRLRPPKERGDFLNSHRHQTSREEIAASLPVLHTQTGLPPRPPPLSSSIISQTVLEPFFHSQTRQGGR